MRRWILYSIASGVLLTATPQMVHAGTTGRRNTAIAATAVAVGAWSNGTGRKGRRNTAIAATAGAAYAWKRYGDKKRQERRRSHTVVVRRVRPARVTVVREQAPSRVVVVRDDDRGHDYWVPPGHRKHGCKHHWKKCEAHWKECKHHRKWCERCDDD